MKRKASKLGPGKFVRFPRPTLARIERIAREERRTVSNTVRVLVEEALVGREFEPKKEAVA